MATTARWRWNSMDWLIRPKQPAQPEIFLRRGTTPGDGLPAGLASQNRSRNAYPLPLFPLRFAPSLVLMDDGWGNRHLPHAPPRIGTKFALSIFLALRPRWPAASAACGGGKTTTPPPPARRAATARRRAPWRWRLRATRWPPTSPTPRPATNMRWLCNRGFQAPPLWQSSET